MASEKILNRKKETVSEIVDKIKNSSALIVVDYKGLSVAKATELRRKLRESESEFKIYKNTLTSLALKEIKEDLGILEGSNALVFSKDALAPIKTVSEFIKKNKIMEMKVGLIDGKVTDINTLNQLAATPDRHTLLTMLAGSMIATVKDLSICLDLYTKQEN